MFYKQLSDIYVHIYKYVYKAINNNKNEKNDLWSSS